MGSQPRRRKHVPQRTCVACRTVRPKRDLVRVVRTPDGVVIVDETGKRSGRGAYLCRQRDCWDRALKGRHLERALKMTLVTETEALLRTYSAELPQLLATDSEESGGAAKRGGGDE